MNKRLISPRLREQISTIVDCCRTTVVKVGVTIRDWFLEFSRALDMYTSTYARECNDDYPTNTTMPSCECVPSSTLTGTGSHMYSSYWINRNGDAYGIDGSEESLRYLATRVVKTLYPGMTGDDEEILRREGWIKIVGVDCYYPSTCGMIITSEQVTMLHRLYSRREQVVQRNRVDGIRYISGGRYHKAIIVDRLLSESPEVITGWLCD